MNDGGRDRRAVGAWRVEEEGYDIVEWEGVGIDIAEADVYDAVGIWKMEGADDGGGANPDGMVVWIGCRWGSTMLTLLV
jgi:hypothetical protein